jgi:nickel-dependent lactate racemase
MAGYSGGRKSVAIGLASVETVKHLHGTKFLEHPGSRNCELQNNLLHHELTEIALLAGVDFCVSTVVNAERRIGGIFCGDLVQSHNSSCEFAERYCVTRVEKPFDIVVTTGAGYPLDTTYYQAIKGLVGALGILSPQGAIILASECSKGLGSGDFRRVLEHLRTLNDYERFLAHIADPENFVIDQWEVEMLVKALRRGTIYLFSAGITEHEWPLTFATRVRSVNDGISLAAARSGQHPRIAIIPEGPYVIPFCDETAAEQARSS